MKKSFLKITAVLALGVTLIFSSCDFWIDPEINVDPDVPTEVPLNLLLPSIQANMAYDLGGNDIATVTNVWMQYMTGYARQMNTIANYTYAPADVNNVWSSCYYVTMMDCKVMYDNAMALETPAYHFAGVSQISMAYTLAVVTDLFGDVPYTEAFQGMENLEPTLDSQESVYAAINQLLDDAIANLSNADNKLALGGDMIHGNSAAAWLKTAYALKARYAMNLSARNATAYADAIAALANAYTSNADNFAFEFGGTSNSWHPITQFLDERNDIVMDKYFIDMLVTDNDPRLPFYADVNGAGNYVGLAAGLTDNANISRPGVYLNDQSGGNFTSFMTYHECKFIEAEAKLASDPAGALAAFKAGVIASMQWVGVDLTTTGYDETINALGSVTMNEILRQKYIANFGQMQAYNDWRRTGQPTGFATPAASTRPLPVRYPYAQNEIIYNSNVEAVWQVTVFLDTKVWWDNN
jgi:hypothetical protein